MKIYLVQNVRRPMSAHASARVSVHTAVSVLVSPQKR